MPVDPFDREPEHLPAREQVLTPVRLAATAAAALPAVGFGTITLFKGITHVHNPAMKCSFHLVLGIALLVLFADIAAVIHRAKDLTGVLLWGVLGFAGAFVAATLSELGGKLALVAFVFVAATWALLIVHPRLGRTLSRIR